MLIALYFFIMNVVLPQISAYAQALTGPIMLIVIIFSGIVMLFGSVGMTISNNLGATIVSAIFRAIGYLCHTIIMALGWIIRNTFRMIPHIFNGSMRIFNELGINTLLSNVLSIIIVVIFVAIII